MFKKILDLIFEPEEEVNDAQIETLLFLSTQFYVEMCGHTLKDAKELAFKRVQKWVNEGRTEIALRKLWQNKFN